MLKLGLSGSPTLLALFFVAALIMPIILYHVARPVPLISVAVTGERHLPLLPRALVPGRSSA